MAPAKQTNLEFIQRQLTNLHGIQLVEFNPLNNGRFRTRRDTATAVKLLSCGTIAFQRRRCVLFDVREEMKSYRFTSVLIAAYGQIPRRASSVNRVGGFRACRSLRRFRLASASSSVSRVGDSGLIFGSSSLCVPLHSRSDRYRSFVRLVSYLPDQMARTSRDAPTGHKLFICISTSSQPRRWAHI